MDFLILNTTGSDLAVNSAVLDTYLAERATTSAAMQYQTTWNDFKSGILTLTTEISLVVNRLDGSLTAISSKQITKYHFPDRTTLTRGATKKALESLKTCIDLSQGHAYGHFLYKAANLDLPLLPAAVQPFELYETQLRSFLKKHSKL
jgi:hypothetical protein